MSTAQIAILIVFAAVWLGAAVIYYQRTTPTQRIEDDRAAHADDDGSHVW